jgi:type I restriction enzyme S subunit
MREGWLQKPLGDVCNVIGGGTPSKRNPAFYEGEIPWATVRDMRNEVLSHTEFCIAKEAIDGSSTNVIPAANVVIATRVGLGKVCLLDQDTAINQDLRGIIPKANDIDERFLFRWFQSVANTIEAEGTGATVKGVKLPFIKSLLLPLPPLPEQKRIVAILDDAFASIDASIANTEKNLANARELFESYLNSVFDEAPCGWIECQLSRICSIKHGFAFKSTYFSDNGPYVVLTPGSFYEQGGFRDQGKKTKYYTGDIPDGYTLQEGDFLFAMTEQAAGLLGSSLIVPKSDYYLHNQRLGLVQVHGDVEWSNDFFFHQFNTNMFRAAVQASASGVKVRHTSPTKLGEIPIKYPRSKLEQVQVADKLNELSAERTRIQGNYQQKLTALAELKQSLLQKAFSGELTADKAAPDVPLKEEACP